MVPPRSFAPEIMDRPDNSHDDLDGALRDIRRVNRYLGGSRTILRSLRPILLEADPDRTVELLDVGTGAADVPIAMVNQARRLGRRLSVTAVDRDPHTAAIAARETLNYPEIRVVRGDALRLPFADGSFDVVTASMFLHHFKHDEIVRLLASFRGLARRAVLINDLRRHLVPWSFISVVSRALGWHEMVVHDGPLSVLRGFVPDELARAAVEAGETEAVLQHRFPYRLVLKLSAARPS